MRTRFLFLVGLILLGITEIGLAEPGITVITASPNKDGGQTYTITIKILFLMTALVFLPSAVMLTTSFARIIIVLSIMRQALGTPQTPSSQILIGLSLFLTLFIMSPIIDVAYQQAIKPYLAEKITDEVALSRIKKPFHKFMLKQTRASDLNLFLKLSKTKLPSSLDQVPFTVLIPAFVISELKTAFQIGFLIFIPFIVIDIVVASVLMSMGMMMLSPMLIALPFKLMLFVLVDGWAMIVGTLAVSFGV